MTRQNSVRLRASLCLVALLFATGCNGRWSMWRNKQPNEIAHDELKDPSRMHLAYAQVNERSGDVEKARDSYNNALKEDERSVEAILGLARLDLLGDRPHQAEQGFLKAAQVAPESSRVAEAVGQFYITQDRFKEASIYLLKGVELNPGDKRLRHRLGLALAKQGQIAAAEPHFIQAVGDAEADYNIGLILYEQGDIDSAEQRFFQASLKKPQLAQAHHWLDTVRLERANQKNMANLQRQAVPQMATQSNDPSAPQPNLPNYAPQDVRLQSGMVDPSNQVVPLPHAQQQHPQLANRFTIDESQRPFNGLGPAINASQPTIQPLTPNTMNATQLEQLENSMTPLQREQFPRQMQNR